MWEIKKCGNHEEVTKTGRCEKSGDEIFKDIEKSSGSFGIRKSRRRGKAGDGNMWVLTNNWLCGHDAVFLA